MRSPIAGFLGALGLVTAGAFTGVSLAALLGVVSTPGLDRVVPVVAVVATALLWPNPEDRRWRGGALLGAVVGSGGLLVIGSVSGGFSIGAGEIGALVGAVAALPVLSLVWSGDHQGLLLARMALAVLAVLVVVALVRSVIEGGALGHDESAYALKARAWLEGTPDSGWQLHRAPLNSLLGMPVIAVTESEVAIRLIASLLTLGTLFSVWLVGNRLGGRWAGVVAAAGVGASLPFLRRGSEYLTDVPAAGLLLVIVWLVLSVVADPDVRKGRVWWFGPLVAAAFYMRYQSALAVVGIAVGAVIVWPRVVARIRRELWVAGGLAALALVPHLIWATVATGTPWGVVLVTQGAAGRSYLGQGLVDYLRAFPDDLAGPAGAALMALAVAWLLWFSFRRQTLDGVDDDTRAARFVSIVVLASVVPLGLVAHGEPRFVFFPVWLLIAVGGAVATRMVSRLRAPLPVAVIGAAAIMWLPLFIGTVNRVDRNAEARGQNFAVVVDASNAIEADAAGSCGVLTTYQPQVTWYSTCWTELFSPETPNLGVDSLQGDREYAVLFVNGKRQPTPEQQEEYLALGPTATVPAKADGIGDATIVFIDEG